MHSQAASKLPGVTARAATLTEALERRGVIRGEAKARQHALLRAMGARRIAVTPEQIAQILGCTAHERLDAWLERVATASSAAEVLTG